MSPADTIVEEAYRLFGKPENADERAQCETVFRSVIAAALAPYLAPHPAQQGEDRKRGWARGYFCAVAVYVKENFADGVADTSAVSLFKQGGPSDHADPEDKETFILHGLLARSHSKQEGGA